MTRCKDESRQSDGHLRKVKLLLATGLLDTIQCDIISFRTLRGVPFVSLVAMQLISSRLGSTFLHS